MPHTPGVTDLSRYAMPNRLNVLVSDGELEALDRASAEMVCSRSQVVRLLIHCLADGGTRLGAGIVAFDCETSHGIVRNPRSIGTPYNQSVAAFNTIAKVAREPLNKNPTLQCVGDQRSSRSSDLGFMP